MLLFLSRSFLSRLKVAWRRNFHAFLLGRRNLYFFTPDHLIETEKIDIETIDHLLRKLGDTDEWELLGFISPGLVAPHTGYVQVVTLDSADPKTWSAELYLQAGSEIVPNRVDIVIAEN